MPSSRPLPTLTELLDAFGAPIAGRHDPDGDLRDMSTYDFLAGLGAMACLREAEHDRERFRAGYYGTAEDADFDALRARRGMSARVVDAPGAGTVYLSRATTSGGAGTFLVGTRFAVWPATTIGTRLEFVCSADTAISAGATTAQVPIVSRATGPHTVLDTNTTTNNGFSVEDAVWDSSWRITRVVCGAGTNREKDQELRARDERTRADTRRGFEKYIRDTMIAAGAGQVALFGSDFRSFNPNGTETVGALDADGYGDTGLNYCIIGNADFSEPSNLLLHDCRVVADKCAVAGVSLQVLKMSPTLVTMTVNLALWDVPQNYATEDMEAETKMAVLHYFSTRDNPFRFRISAIRGGVMNAIRDAQQVTISVSPAEPTLPGMFQALLVPRYYVTNASITVNITS